MDKVGYFPSASSLRLDKKLKDSYSIVMRAVDLYLIAFFLIGDELKLELTV